MCIRRIIPCLASFSLLLLIVVRPLSNVSNPFNRQTWTSVPSLFVNTSVTTQLAVSFALVLKDIYWQLTKGIVQVSCPTEPKHSSQKVYTACTNQRREQFPNFFLVLPATPYNKSLKSFVTKNPRLSHKTVVTKFLTQSHSKMSPRRQILNPLQVRQGL